MLSYIIQVILFQFLFLLGYELLLQKETFFSYNRWYLLSTSLLAFLLPLINIEGLSEFVPEETISHISNIWLPEVFIGEQQQFSESLPAVQISANTSEWNLWNILYFTGVMGSLFLVFRKFQNLIGLFRFNIISKEKGFKVIQVPESDIACTFYQTIFLGDQLSGAERNQILNHELVHVKQKHSLDLIWFEILKIIFWFNPLIYLYQNKIAAVHEFIADEVVVKNTGKLNYYEQLLNSAFSTRNISFINQFFNHSLIKKRIVMLQKSKSKTIVKFKYLVILPLMLVMLMVVSCSQEDPDNLESEETLSEQLDKLKLKIEESEEISSEERKKIMEVTMAAIVKSKNSEGEDKPGFNADVPFALIEQVPVYPGCESLGSNEEQKKCMSDKITEYVNQNFNTGLGKELNLKGVNRIIVQFKIDKDGNVVEARARAPHPALEEEAIRVIEGIPQMEPGKQKGEEVGVMYSLPIVFQVGE